MNLRNLRLFESITWFVCLIFMILIFSSMKTDPFIHNQSLKPLLYLYILNITMILSYVIILLNGIYSPITKTLYRSPKKKGRKNGNK